MTNPASVDEQDVDGPATDDAALFNDLMALDNANAESLLAPDGAADKPDATVPEPDETPAGDDPDPDASEADKPTDAVAEADTTDPVADDPLAGLLENAKPLSITVNDAARTFDAILELDGKGGFIPADKLDEVRNLVARYESNAEATRELFAFRKEVDRLGGVDKFHETAEQNAQLNAASLLILNAVTQNPAQFVNPDGTPNRERIEFLIQQAGVQAERARYDYRKEREQQAAQWTDEATEATVRDGAIPNAIHAVAGRFGLTDADVQAAIAQFTPLASALLFKATPEQAQQFGVKPGTWMVDLPKMEPWLRERQEWRKAQAADADRRAKAAKENAARTAQPRNPATGQFAKPKPAPKQPTAASVPPKMSASTMRRLALAGKPIPGDDDFVES